MKYANYYLLASIVLVMFLGPMAFDYGMLSLVNLEILFLIILIASIFLHKHNTKLFKITVVSLILILINILIFDLNQSVFQYFLKLLIIGITIIELFKEILRTKIIDAHIISGAVSIYILIGVFWYLLYMFLLMIDPDSFTFNLPHTNKLSIDMLYFSFTTLTTLGYGDITPTSYTAKMWAMTEAMVGVMFLAVMIGRLISHFNSHLKN
ncbi:MAG: two pore domain potassium channel family protein [Nitrosomonadales bacterium]|nr:two pore domain potassium channel family protein [Nitrosomonadales bacterium]